VHGILKHRLFPPLVIAATALASWLILPGTGIERGLLDLCVRGFANPPFFITAEDGRMRGWKLRTVSSKPRVDPDHAPRLISLGDDPEGVFQTSPPSPIDLAVILSNFRRLGADHAAIAAVLAWDAPDPIGLTALERTLAGFDSLVMAAPLGRGAVAGPMPPAFRDTSIAATTIHGDTSRLPIVNRIPVTAVILGAENTRAGFQFLESERPSRFAPMLARWEDRVVFAFPLLAAMQGLGLQVDEIEVRLGESIRLGASGPVVPIDESGRLAMPVPRRDFSAIPAADLIDAADDRFAGMPEIQLVLRDDRGGAEPATRAFSAAIPVAMAVISGDTGLDPPRRIMRTSMPVSLLLLAGYSVLLVLSLRLTEFPGILAFTGLAGIAVIAQFKLTVAGLWMPGLPAMLAWAAALAVGKTTAANPAQAAARTR